MKTFTDDVNGQIIGGDYVAAWVSYEGRKQGRTIYAENQKQAEQMLTRIVLDIQDELGDSFKLIYPKKEWDFNYSN